MKTARWSPSPSAGSGATGGKSCEAASTAEGFTTVLLDLKTLLEGGSSTNLSRDKAHLIQRQRN
jgi:hypothetical protein